MGLLSSSEMLRMSLCVTVGIHKSPIHAIGIIKFKEPFMQGASLAPRKRELAQQLRAAQLLPHGLGFILLVKRCI